MRSTRAFNPMKGPMLVIKTINGDARLNDLERLRAAAAGRRDIHIVDEYYTAEQKNALLGLCDCYVSLHRSEGLRADDGRGDGAREAGDRDRLFRQPRLHDRGQQLSRRLLETDRSRPSAIPIRPAPSGPSRISIMRRR